MIGITNLYTNLLLVIIQLVILMTPCALLPTKWCAAVATRIATGFARIVGEIPIILSTNQPFLGPIVGGWIPTILSSTFINWSLWLLSLIIRSYYLLFLSFIPGYLLILVAYYAHNSGWSLLFLFLAGYPLLVTVGYCQFLVIIHCQPCHNFWWLDPYSCWSLLHHPIINHQPLIIMAIITTNVDHYSPY